MQEDVSGVGGWILRLRVVPRERRVRENMRSDGAAMSADKVEASDALHA